MGLGMGMQIQCAYAQLLPVSELKAHPRNPNDHTPEQIARLAEILAYQGWRTPIRISKRSGLMTAGHGRLEAAIHNGWTEVPVDFQDYENEEQEYADLVADNAIASWAALNFKKINEELPNLGPDFDVDMLGIRDFVLEPLDKLEPVGDPDAVPDHVEPKAKPGDVYLLGDHRVMCGDSTSPTDLEKLLNGEMADMVWTDPPYNVDYEGKTKDALKIKNDKMSDTQFREFLVTVFTQMFMGVAAGGAIYVAHADSEGYNFRGAMREGGFLVKQCLIWVKQSMVMGRQDYHWKHEPILYGWKEGAAHHWYADRKQTTVLEFDRPTKSPEHPTTKPVDLIEYCLTNSSKPGQTVLDLFLGSGSTLIAAEKTRRRCFGMEIDPKYVDVIVARWERYTGRKAVLEDASRQA